MTAHDKSLTDAQSRFHTVPDAMRDELEQTASKLLGGSALTPLKGTRLPRPPGATRKIAAVSKTHFNGHLLIDDDEGQVMEVESHTEMNVALITLARHDVVDLENQVAFPWIDADDVTHTHFFDFRVSFRDGSRTAIMVKASKRLESEDFVSKARLIASQVTPEFADRVCLMTERHIDPIELHNAELLHSVRLPDPEADAAARRASREILGAVPVGSLVEAMGLRGRGFRAVVRLMRKHELELVSQERISYEAMVRRRAA